MPAEAGGPDAILSCMGPLGMERIRINYGLSGKKHHKSITLGKTAIPTGRKLTFSYSKLKTGQRYHVCKHQQPWLFH